MQHPSAYFTFPYFLSLKLDTESRVGVEGKEQEGKNKTKQNNG
jgi:hypothetical protein